MPNALAKKITAAVIIIILQDKLRAWARSK